MIFQKWPRSANKFKRTSCLWAFRDHYGYAMISADRYSETEEAFMRNYRAEQTSLETLLEQFELRNESRVYQYLQQYSFLLPLILEAKAQITRFFSDATRAALEVCTDPSDGSSQLYLVIPTRLKAEEAYSRFEKLDQGWWLEASERAQFRMNIVPEFI